MANGYDTGLAAGPPHGVELDVIDVGRPRPNDQYAWSIRCAPMSPMALTPNGTQPRQLNGWQAGGYGMSCGTGPRQRSQLSPGGRSRELAAMPERMARSTVRIFQLGGAGGRAVWPGGGAGGVAGAD